MTTPTFGVKYIGSKNKLLHHIYNLASTLVKDVDKPSLLDVFTGTTRVAQAFRAKGWDVTTCDLAWAAQEYSALFMQTTPEDLPELRSLATELDALQPDPDQVGWIESTYSDAPAAITGASPVRVWQQHNAKKADAIRDTIDHWVQSGRTDATMGQRLTALLILALDSVDNTVGVQQAYLKQWCARSFSAFSLASKIPPDDWLGWRGPIGTHICGDALAVPFSPATVAYVDPPYTTHSYATYYHIWDSISRWDKPGVLLKTNRRADRVASSGSRDASMVSLWNRRGTALTAFQQLIRHLPARWIVISYSSDALVPIRDLLAAIEKMKECEDLQVHSVDHTRNVMAFIGNGADAANRSTVTEYLITVQKA